MYITKQEGFNKAVAGLASQGFQQSISGETCLYRGPDGRRCGIGWLIENKDYKSILEGRSVDDADVMAAANINDQEDRHFFYRLQKAHDKALSPDAMKRMLRFLAQDYNLEVPAELKENIA